MSLNSSSGDLVAVLGPTNTGKTHLAVERMLGHASGMIGLPLRLLAREIYDRVSAVRGAASVATRKSTSPDWNSATWALRVRGLSEPITTAAPPRWRRISSAMA